MRSKQPLEALLDIIQNIDLACRFIEGMTYEDFKADTRTVYAVTRCLEIISEASRRLPTDLKLRHPYLPWTDIAGAGNVYRHDYEDVLEQQLWETVRRGLNALRAAADEELRRTEGN